MLCAFKPLRFTRVAAAVRRNDVESVFGRPGSSPPVIPWRSLSRPCTSATGSGLGYGTIDVRVNVRRCVHSAVSTSCCPCPWPSPTPSAISPKSSTSRRVRCASMKTWGCSSPSVPGREAARVSTLPGTARDCD